MLAADPPSAWQPPTSAAKVQRVAMNKKEPGGNRSAWGMTLTSGSAGLLVWGDVVASFLGGQEARGNRSKLSLFRPFRYSVNACAQSRRRVTRPDSLCLRRSRSRIGPWMHHAHQHHSPNRDRVRSRNDGPQGGLHPEPQAWAMGRRRLTPETLQAGPLSVFIRLIRHSEVRE